MMDLTSFQHHADTFGGDLSRWPREVLSAAAQTLRHAPEAQGILDRALAFDAQLCDALHALPLTPVSNNLRARLLSVPDDLSIPAPLLWMALPRHLAAGIVLLLMLGIFAGAVDLVPNPTHEANKTAWIFAPDETIDE